VHFVSNVEIENGATGGEATLYCNALIHEMRPGDHQQLQYGLGAVRTLAARCRYRLRRDNGLWRIVEKRVLLLDRDLPQRNITFIL